MLESKISIILGVVGSVIAGAFGGWKSSLTTLCVFMLIDYVTGLICAGVFHKSSKTDTGAIESSICVKGLFRKCAIIVLVYMGHRIDIEIGASYLRDGICIAFIVSEAISITENMGLMGVPVPQMLIDGLDVLKKKESSKEETT